MAMAHYRAWWPGRGQTQEDARAFLAVDHRHAATLWADWYDAYSTEYPIVGGEVAEVLVLRDGNKTPKTVKVRGWPSREYASDQVE